MWKRKIVSSLLAVSLLAPLLMSCSKQGSDKTVSGKDPWYESTRLELKTDQQPTEMLDSSIVSYSNGKIYHLYSLTNLADYDNYRRTMLTTYDDKGNQLSSLKVTDPKNYSIDRIISAKPDENGKTLEAVITAFASGGFVTAIIDIDIESGKSGSPRFLEKEKGKALELSGDGMDTYGVSDVYVAGDYYIPVIYAGSDAVEMGAHAFVFKGSEYKADLDFTGIPSVYVIDGFSYDSRNKTVLAVGYTRSDGAVVIEFDPETGKRIKYEKYTVQNGEEVNLADFSAVTSGELCKIDMLGNITTFDMQSQEVKTVIDNNWYTPYFSDLMIQTKLISCDSERAVFVSSKESDYSMFFSGMDETVTILTKADKNPHAGKKVIEIAAPIDKGMSEYLSNAIYEFNKSDNEYLIRVWSKYKTGIKVGRDMSMLNVSDEKLYTMIQELKGSEAPDLAVGIQKYYAMRDDIFEDLTGYLDQSVMDKQFSNMIESSRFGGKQYFLPVTIEIEGLVTDKSLVKAGDVGITFEDFDKLIKDKLEGFSPYDYPMSKSYYKKDFVLSCIDIKSAVEGGKVDFGTDQFRAAAEYAKDNFAEDGFTKPEDYVWAEEEKRVRTGCRYDKIDSYVAFIRACKTTEGEYTILGTPSVDASGPRFRASETISVTSSSARKEGAKKFLNFLFAGAGYSDSAREFQNIVTNKEIMVRNMSIITEQNNRAQDMFEALASYMTGLEKDARIYGYKRTTKKLEENFMASLSSLSRYYYDDPVITTFLTEEIAPYYAGDRSIDDVIKILNDRTSKYVNEM